MEILPYFLTYESSVMLDIKITTGMLFLIELENAYIKPDNITSNIL